MKQLTLENPSVKLIKKTTLSFFILFSIVVHSKKVYITLYTFSEPPYKLSFLYYDLIFEIILYSIVRVH